MKQRAFSSVGGLLGVALITLLLARPMPAHSVSEEIKRWVQNDCRAVSKVIPSLTEAERNKLAHYLFFVLEVPTDMLEMPDLTTAAPTLGGIPAPAPESLPRELLRLKDFSLQRQAQACALHLLPQLSPTSYELLPRLCALMGNYASQQKELQLQAKLLELTSGLALRAANVSKDQDWSKCKISKNGNSEKGRPSASP
ncbi:MAG: hypothetical protein GX589_06340, partial [Deltaproteobacteria bacterium]|nr:hypothetical protein [Deltaproteobacteria bacterium]